MEMSITSEMISQQTICGDNESLELNNDVEYNLNYSKEKTKFEKSQNNLKQGREVYFKYFPSQKIACTKATIRKRALMGIKTVPQPHHPRTSWTGLNAKDRHQEPGKAYQSKTPTYEPNVAQKILTWHQGSKGNKEVSEDHRTSHPNDAISEGGEGDTPEGSCLTPHPSKCCPDPP